MRRGSRILPWAGGTTGVLVLAVLAAEAAGWPFLRHPLARVLTYQTSVPVQLEGAFKLHLLFRPRVTVEHLKVGAAGGIAVPHLLDAQGVDLRWRWRDVWRWRQGAVLRVHSLQARQLDAHLVRRKDGSATWQLGTTPAGHQTDAAEPSAPAGLPRFGSLLLDAGHIVVDDQPLQTRLVVDVKGGEGETPANGTAPGARTGYTARADGQWRALPLHLQLRTGGALPLLRDLESPDDDAPAWPLRVEGQAGAAQLLFDGTASALLGQRKLQGALRFSGPSLARVGTPLGLTLPDTPPFSLQGQLGHAAGVWHLRAERAAIGRSELEGDFRFDSSSKPPRLTGRLGGRRLALADLGPAVGATAAAAAAASAPSITPAPQRKVLPQRAFDLPSLKAMDADVQVAIGELDFNSPSISALRNLQTHLVLQGGVLELQDLKAAVAGGQFSGRTRLDANPALARWDADLAFSGIDIAGWLPGVRSATGREQAPARGDTAALKRQRNQAGQGGEQPVRAYLTGTLNGSLQAQGRGTSTAQILSTLDGKARVALKDGSVSHLLTELMGLDVAQALGVWIGRDQPLPLRCAVVDLQMQKGVVRPQRAVLDNADSTLRLNGEIDLRDETLALRAVVRPKDFSPLALRAPITVGGTLAAPTVGVDGQRLAGKLLGALALGAAVGPAAALLPLIDPGDRNAGDPCL